MKNKFLTVIFIFMFPLSTFASGFGDDGDFILVDILNNLINLLTSEIGGGIAVLAIVGVGYGWLAEERISAKRAITTIVSISVIFGAAWLAGYLGIISQQ